MGHMTPINVGMTNSFGTQATDTFDSVTDSTPAIEVEQLVREFRKGPRAVDGIDLSVSQGEIYGFLGPNGAGKSTTVLMLTTLLPPTSGRATVGGFDIVRQGAQVRSTIGAALQEAALDPLLTGREHLMLQATLQGIGKPDRVRRTTALLDRVGLSEAADRRVGGYSGGMKRRLDLGLALVHQPRILFLDEPTTGLDPQSRSALWEEVARLAHEEGMTVFLTTQYLEEADALADRVGIIDHGKIVAEGTPARLKAEIGSPSVEVTPQEPNAGDSLERLLSSFGELRRNGRGSVTVQLPRGEAQLAEVVRVLDQGNLRVESLQLHQPSLDDVFLAKTGRKLEGAAQQDEGEEPAGRGRRRRRRGDG
jgi:ABC-2 type transport system ATP-binding protein